MRRFRLWVLIVVIATTVIAGGVALHASGGSPRVRLATSGDASSQGSGAGIAPTTTTSAPAVPAPTPDTSTTRVTATTQRPTTTTHRATIQPTTTSVAPGPDPGHARIWVQNDYAAAVRVSVGDETTNAWSLEPGANAGPWDLTTSLTHGDGASVARVDNRLCGASDGENYFTGGHEYKLVVGTRSTDCENGPAPELFIHDLTTGGTRSI